MALARCLSTRAATLSTAATISRRGAKCSLCARTNCADSLNAPAKVPAALIGSFAYRSDYDTVLAEQKLLQRAAAEKNCSFASPLQSDQTIR